MSDFFAFRRRDALPLKRAATERQLHPQPYSQEQTLPPEKRDGLRTIIVTANGSIPAATKDPDGVLRLGMGLGNVWERCKCPKEGNSQDPDNTIDARGNKLSKVMYLDQSYETQLVRRIFNPDFNNTYHEGDILFGVEDNYGDIYIIEALINTTTTSTSTSTSTTPTPCEGRCKWLWSEADNKWTLDDDGCNATTSTTSTSSTSSTTSSSTTSSTSTTPGCECFDVGSSTSSTSSTTTTTQAPDCNCTYPLFCGLTDGDCTYTYCLTGEQAPPNTDCTTTTSTSSTSSTSSTTSTTCDCNTTTTTTAAPGCVVGCDWSWLPLLNGGFGWHQLSSDCTSDCPCPAPTGAGTDCEARHTPCISIPPPPPPPPPSCRGDCEYWWCPPIGVWVLTHYGCLGVREPCECVPPSAGGTDCAPTTVPCQSPTTTTSVPTTTTANPCSIPCHTCYPNCTSTTTSSSSTTTTPCAADCTWRWNGSSWENEANPCGSGCPCYSPPYDGIDQCELEQTPCRGTTTTSTTTSTSSTTTSSTTSSTTSTTTSTSTTSTTTTTCQPQYRGICVSGMSGSELLCDSGGGPVCEPCNGFDPDCCQAFDTLVACEAAQGDPCSDCGNPETTSTTTTTTTTAGCAGTCNWICIDGGFGDGFWAGNGDDCTGGCGCSNSDLITPCVPDDTTSNSCVNF